MARPTLELKGESNPVIGLTLWLGLGDGPILAAAIDLQNDFDRAAALLSRSVATFKWNGFARPFELLGFTDGVDPPPAASGRAVFAVGRCLTNPVREWLGRVPEVTDERPITKVVYQRGERQSAAQFFGAVFENRLNTETGDFALLDRTPGAFGCLVRSAAIDNRAHLDRVCREVAGDTPALLGWWSTAEEQKSLRFAFAGTAPNLKLGAGWPDRGQSQDIGGYDVDAMSPRPITLQRDFRVTAPAEFLEDLLTLGNQTLASRLRGVASPDQVPLAPGFFAYGERAWICPRLRFDFNLKGMQATLAAAFGGAREDHVTSTVTLAEPRPSPRPPSAVNLLEGEVKGWSEDHQWLALEPGEGVDWRMVVLDDGSGKPPPPLWCAAHSLTGFAPEREHAGIYVRHVARDRLVALVADRQTPRSLGGRQLRIEQLEEAEIDLGLGANSVAILTGGSGAAPEQGSGIRMAGPDAVISGETLKVFERTLSISDGSIDAEAKMTIKGTLDVSK
jgi:hypothetical protein